MGLACSRTQVEQLAINSSYLSLGSMSQMTKNLDNTKTKLQIAKRLFKILYKVFQISPNNNNCRLLSNPTPGAVSIPGRLILSTAL